jgi:hypothetical protein
MVALIRRYNNLMDRNEIHKAIFVARRMGKLAYEIQYTDNKCFDFDFILPQMSYKESKRFIDSLDKVIDCYKNKVTRIKVGESSLDLFTVCIISNFRMFLDNGLCVAVAVFDKVHKNALYVPKRYLSRTPELRKYYI